MNAAPSRLNLSKRIMMHGHVFAYKSFITSNLIRLYLIKVIPDQGQIY